MHRCIDFKLRCRGRSDPIRPRPDLICEHLRVDFQVADTSVDKISNQLAISHVHLLFCMQTSSAKLASQSDHGLYRRRLLTPNVPLFIGCSYTYLSDKFFLRFIFRTGQNRSTSSYGLPFLKDSSIFRVLALVDIAFL